MTSDDCPKCFDMAVRTRNPGVLDQKYSRARLRTKSKNAGPQDQKVAITRTKDEATLKDMQLSCAHAIHEIT